MEDNAYRRYLLIVLMVILAFTLMDGLALGLMLQEIKGALHLGDTQLGLLTGIAYALFYAVAGIPIARYADRGHRVRIISITTALWGLAVMACGMAGNFLQLLLIRVVVAVGEAGCIPIAHSLIAAHFARAERPRAVSRFMLASPLSVLIGFFLAGWLNQFYGWRVTFMMLGLPGIALGLLAWLTLREPSRAAEAEPIEPPTVRQVFRTLSRNSTFRHLLVCFSIMSFFGYGIGQWQPAFFIRSYGFTTGELGTWFTLIHGLAAMVGLYAGGEWASRVAMNREHVQLRMMAVVYVAFGIVTACIYLVSNHYIAFGLMALGAVASGAASGPLFATIQTLVPPSMRATSMAIIYLFANLVGLGLGPLAAGVMSDAFHAWAGAESLRYSLLALTPGFAWGAWHVWCASRTARHDVEAAGAALTDVLARRHRSAPAP
jgi:predicted MFS family arabinose efflux permease